MKIAIFSDTFFPSVNGVATVVHQSAKNLAQSGHEVRIFTVCPRSNIEAFWTDEKISVISWPSIPAGVYKGERFTLPVGLAFRHLKEFHPDIIHTHTPFSIGWEAIWAARKLKIPLVGTHHTFYDHYLKHIKADFEWAKKLSWRYTTFFYNFCDLVLSPSQSLADTLIAKGLKKPFYVLRNPIETDLFIPCQNEKTKADFKKELGLKGKSLVFTGRVSYEKSIDQVLKAFSLAIKKNADIQLMIVGDGPEKNNLEKLAANLDIKEKVIFTGILERGTSLIRALQANEVFITASKTENMPMTVIEAMAVGLPMIAVPEKGLAEIIKHDINGFLTPADRPAEMAEKILELMNNINLLKKFSEGSRALAMEFSKENITCQLLKAYEKIIKSKL